MRIREFAAGEVVFRENEIGKPRRQVAESGRAPKTLVFAQRFEDVHSVPPTARVDTGGFPLFPPKKGSGNTNGNTKTPVNTKAFRSIFTGIPTVPTTL
jgi:hypothetical protein